MPLFSCFAVWCWGSNAGPLECTPQLSHIPSPICALFDFSAPGLLLNQGNQFTLEIGINIFTIILWWLFQKENEEFIFCMLVFLLTTKTNTCCYVNLERDQERVILKSKEWIAHHGISSIFIGSWGDHYLIRLATFLCLPLSWPWLQNVVGSVDWDL